jgi:hypothetical protein
VDRANTFARIADLQEEADRLAGEFKNCFQLSKEAHADGDYELAQELSESGRALLERCNVLNAEANRLRKLLHLGPLDARIQLQHYAPLSIHQASSSNPVSLTARTVLRSQTPQTIAFIDWPKRLTSVERELEKFVARLPGEHAKAIASVRFIDNIVRTTDGRVKGGSCDSHGAITLRAWPKDADEEESILRTFAHEIGHAVLHLRLDMLEDWQNLFAKTREFRAQIKERYYNLSDAKLAREGFAEAYSEHLLYTASQFALNHAIYTFMCDRVFTPSPPDNL